MSARVDLSRWNRAGLGRFVYVDGNAPLYLEQLREEFERHFEGRWSELPEPPDVADADKLLPERLQFERNKRIVAQYQGERRDIAWELTRVFARACHVLTGHVDAHANEAFLRTATQWEYVRRLVATIGYRPAPAASATTLLIITAKDGKRGPLPKGFQVKHAPPDGGPQVVFETFEDIDVDAELNALRPAGWDRSDAPLDDGPAPEPTLQDSTAASYRVIGIQGVGPIRAQRLDTLVGPDGFRIRDFLDVDPENPGLSPANAIPETWLREFRAKAIAIATFSLEPGWAAIVDWLLPDIIDADREALRELTTRSFEQIDNLRLRIELVGAYLDDAVYRSTRLEDLISRSTFDSEAIETTFEAKRKPKVERGQVAIVFHTGLGIGEAVTIAAVSEPDDA